MKLVKFPEDVVAHASQVEPVTDFRRVHVWVCDLDVEPPEPLPLSAKERVRAMELESPADRRRFVSRATFVRRVLASATGTDPGTLMFLDGNGGKPEVFLPIGAQGGSWTTLDFSLSDSENILALALVYDGEIGIDIEARRHDVEYMSKARSRFTTEEREQLGTLPADEAITAFYHMWTRREAMAKGGRRRDSSTALSAASAGAGLALHTFEIRAGGREVIGAIARWDLGGPSAENHSAISRRGLPGRK